MWLRGILHIIEDEVWRLILARDHECIWIIGVEIILPVDVIIIIIHISFHFWKIIEIMHLFVS